VIDKQRIAATFAAAAPNYDTHAVVQRHAARHLAERVRAQWPSLGAVPHIVEIGCGTGNLTEPLWRAYPHADLLAIDVAPSMVQACRQRMAALAQRSGPAEGAGRVRFAVADGEHMACPDADLVASSLVFQWFADQGATLRRLAAQVPRLAVATLLDGTFAEWKAAHVQQGLVDGVRDFMTAPALQALCADIGGTCAVETVHEHYPDVLQFVRSLKAIGAGTARPGHQPAPLRRLLRAFPQGITVSYRVAYVLVENTSLLGR
jgi:malonyl-ACP O-methyltransferase BioC